MNGALNETARTTSSWNLPSSFLSTVCWRWRRLCWCLGVRGANVPILSPPNHNGCSSIILRLRFHVHHWCRSLWDAVVQLMHMEPQPQYYAAAPVMVGWTQNGYVGTPNP